jgi:hypothetical protein
MARVAIASKAHFCVYGFRDERIDERVISTLGDELRRGERGTSRSLGQHDELPHACSRTSAGQPLTLVDDAFGAGCARAEDASS